MPPEFNRKWGTECLNTGFPLPTLLFAGYSVKLIIIRHTCSVAKAKLRKIRNVELFPRPPLSVLTQSCLYVEYSGRSSCFPLPLFRELVGVHTFLNYGRHALKLHSSFEHRQNGIYCRRLYFAVTYDVEVSKNKV